MTVDYGMRFYSVPMPGCFVHPDKAGAYEIRRGSELYRRACAQACADRQIADLHRSHNRESERRHE